MTIGIIEGFTDLVKNDRDSSTPNSLINIIGLENLVREDLVMRANMNLDLTNRLPKIIIEAKNMESFLKRETLSLNINVFSKDSDELYKTSERIKELVYVPYNTQNREELLKIGNKKLLASDAIIFLVSKGEEKDTYNGETEVHRKEMEIFIKYVKREL